MEEFNSMNSEDELVGGDYVRNFTTNEVNKISFI